MTILAFGTGMGVPAGWVGGGGGSTGGCVDDSHGPDPRTKPDIDKATLPIAYEHLPWTGDGTEGVR